MAFTKKQNAEIISATEELKTIVAKIDPNGEAPAFAPYRAEPEYESPYSPTLLEKANALAAETWNGAEGYNKAQQTGTTKRSFFLGDPPVALKEGEEDVFAKNQSYFNGSSVTLALARIFRVGQPWPTPADGGWQVQQNMTALIKKLKRLEKQGEEVLDDDSRERLMESVLLPSNLYGVFNATWGGMNYLNLRFPTQAAVARDVLTQEEVNLIETLINYIPRIRCVVGDYMASPGHFKETELLTPILDAEIKYSNSEQDAQMLVRLKKMNDFFTAALPFNLQQDMIPQLRYPRATQATFEALKQVSSELRNAALGFLREETPLSALLEKIVALSEKLLAYFGALAAEVEGVFNFLTRIGVSYPVFVSESKQRVMDSEFPW